MRDYITFKDVLNEAKIGYYTIRARYARTPINRAKHLAMALRHLILRPQCLWNAYKEMGAQ